jgi:hypothetical protein
MKISKYSNKCLNAIYDYYNIIPFQHDLLNKLENLFNKIDLDYKISPTKIIKKLHDKYPLIYLHYLHLHLNSCVSIATEKGCIGI